MNLDFDSLTDAEVLGVIRRAGAVPKKGGVFLQRYPTNNTREDSEQRMSFRVWVGNEATIHLVVGRSLALMHRHSVAFHRNNPEISVRPLFFIQNAGVDFVGQECSGLFNLEEAFAAGKIDAGEWQQAIVRVTARLSATAKASSMSHLMTEIADFERSVLAISAFSRIDTAFLRDTVLPLIRLEANRIKPVTAWTNGDFIAKNIVLDASGLPHLVDYEFAGRTHFPQADWFRLQRFSSVPAGTKLEDIGAPVPLPAWLEMRCWLDHLVKMDTVCSAASVLADLPKVSAHLNRLIDATGKGQRHSVFFDLAGAATPKGDHQLADLSETLLVEWSAHGSGAWKAEPPVSLQSHIWNEVQVDLSGVPGRSVQFRLRLPYSPCVVELRGVEVYGRERGKVLWTVDSKQLNLVLTSKGNLLDIPTAEGLGIIHFGGESHVVLPPVRLARSEGTVGLALWVRYVPDLSDFAQRLRRGFAEGNVPAFLTDVQAPTQIEGGEGPHRVTAQLFFPDGQNHTEERSIRSPLGELNAWTELAFEIPPLPAGAVLRLDPVDEPGLLEIASLTLEPIAAEGALPGLPVRSRASSWLEHIRCEGDSVLLPDAEGKLVLVFGKDPIFKLAPLAEPVANRACRLVISFRFSTNAPVSVWARQLQGFRDSVTALNVRLHQLKLQTETAAAELARRTESDHEHRTREVAQLRLQLGQAQSELQKNAQQLAAGAAATAALGQEVAALKAQLTESRATAAKIQAENAAQRQREQEAQAAALKSAGEQAEKLRMQSEQSRAQADTFRQELAALQARRNEEQLASERNAAVLRKQLEQAEAGIEAQKQATAALQGRHVEELHAAQQAARDDLAQRDQYQRNLANELAASQRAHAADTQRNEAERQRLSQGLAQAQTAEESLRLELARLQEQLAAAVELGKTRESALGRHAENLALRSAELAKLQAELSSAREQAARRESELDQRQAGLEEQLAAATARAIAHTSRIASLEVDLAQRHRELAALREEAVQHEAEFNRQYAGYLATIDALKSAASQGEEQSRQEILAAETRYKTAESDFNALREQHLSLVESLHAQNEAIENITHQSAMIEQERQLLAEQLADATARLTALESVLAEVERRPLVRLDSGARRLLGSVTSRPAAG